MLSPAGHLRAIPLGSNQPSDRFYLGGEKIRGFRALASSGASGERVPEDWVASTTAVFGEAEIGLTRLPSGDLLKDAIAADPGSWLGEEHVSRFGSDPKLLIKLLDAAERLPVHIHPSKEFARAHVGSAHGKAEAWYILEGGTVHLGFNRPVGMDDLAEWVETQNTEEILAAMHLIKVSAGDSVYVPPGLPHAIGAGVFIIEVQEPEDMSILLEWKGFAIDGQQDGHIGLGFETALTATDRSCWTLDQLERLMVRGGTGGHTLAPAAAEYFRAERYDIKGELALDAGFGALVFLAGAGAITSADGIRLPVQVGETILTPFGLGELVVSGVLSFLRCRPPSSRASVTAVGSEGADAGDGPGMGGASSNR